MFRRWLLIITVYNLPPRSTLFPAAVWHYLQPPPPPAQNTPIQSRNNDQLMLAIGVLMKLVCGSPSQG